MDHVRSAALNFMIPAGCVYDPPGSLGIASVLADMITRGFGDRDRPRSDVGCSTTWGSTATKVSVRCTRASGPRQWARNILGLRLRDLRGHSFCAPTCRKTKSKRCRCSLLPQDLQNLEDEPRQKVLIELKGAPTIPALWGRGSSGHRAWTSRLSPPKKDSRPLRTLVPASRSYFVRRRHISTGNRYASRWAASLATGTFARPTPP